MFDAFRQGIAEAIFPARAPKRTGKRAYAGAEYDRLTADWFASGTSQDSETVGSLRTLRNRSRQLVRDHEYAKNAVRTIQNNVIGQGIGLQAQVSADASGKLFSSVNKKIETAWCDWWHDKNIVHTGGALSGPDMERMLIGNVVESGEALVRFIDKPFGAGSKIPLALEVIESDRLMDQWTLAYTPSNAAIRMGVEVDEWNRPQAYWLYPLHPGDYQFSVFSPDNWLRVPAVDMCHLFIVDRWPQTRGIPWFHSTIRRLNDMRGYEQAEIVAARATASVMGFIKSPDDQVPDDVMASSAASKRVQDMAPGQVRHLLPGEEFQGFNPSRPNTGLDPFMRAMLRAVAAGTGVSYESLSKDYSQSNYSSSRLALLDDRDTWKVLQGWFVRNFRVPLFKRWLAAATLAGVVELPGYAANPGRYEKPRFRPRGWSWVDPTKEVTAYRDAVRSGFRTLDDVIAETGGGLDLDDVMQQRREELDTMKELELVFDTDPAQVARTGVVQPIEAPAPLDSFDTPAPGDGDGADKEPDAKEPGEPAAGKAPAADKSKPSK